MLFVFTETSGKVLAMTTDFSSTALVLRSFEDKDRLRVYFTSDTGLLADGLRWTPLLEPYGDFATISGPPSEVRHHIKLLENVEE